MIVRKWQARIRTKDERAYIAYIDETGAADIGGTEGNLGFQILTRRHPDETTTIVMLSWWRDLDAIRRFAGEDYEKARYYAEDDRYLLEMNETVEHYVVAIDRRG
jgi:heme-degrading monooxygenase HmoA